MEVLVFVPVGVGEDSCSQEDDQLHGAWGYLDSVFEGENGYLTDSEEEMEQKILELAGNKEKLKAFGQKSLEITKRFTIESHVKKTVKVYEEVIKAYPNKINDIEVMKMIEDF